MADFLNDDRACLDWAYRVVIGHGAENDVYVTREGAIVDDGTPSTLDPSGCALDATVVTLAQMMKFHLRGVGFGKLRDDLLGSGVGEQFANRVHDHLVDVSVEEWDRLRERVRWYADDNRMPIFRSSTVSG